MKNYLKSLVFYQANEMIKNQKVSQSVALKIAWQIYRMKKSNEPINFIYKKIDGSTRFATGIFDKSISDKDIKAQHYFDIEKQEFRAFRPSLFVCTFNQQ